MLALRYGGREAFSELQTYNMKCEICLQTQQPMISKLSNAQSDSQATFKLLHR